MIKNLPDWIQAFAAIAITVFTGWTLKVLRKYAADTEKIAKVTSSQLENSLLPFLVVVMRESNDNRQGGWVLENQGFGPALNILYSHYQEGRTAMLPMPPLGVRDRPDSMHGQISDALLHEEGFRIEYESLSGNRFRTIFASVNGRTETRFVRL